MQNITYLTHHIPRSTAAYLSFRGSPIQVQTRLSLIDFCDQMSYMARRHSPLPLFLHHTHNHGTNQLKDQIELNDSFLATLTFSAPSMKKGIGFSSSSTRILKYLSIPLCSDGNCFFSFAFQLSAPVVTEYCLGWD
jgi:hypothetical protein